MQNRGKPGHLGVVLACCALLTNGALAKSTTEKAVVIVAKIQRADYEGNRAALSNCTATSQPTPTTSLLRRASPIGGDSRCGAVR